MRIFIGRIKDFNDNVDEAVSYHMKPIFEAFQKNETISATLGGPVYVIEKETELSNIRLTTSDLLNRLPITEQEDPCFEYAEWTRYGEYLFVVDSCTANGAASYFVKKEAVNSELLRKLKIESYKN